MSDSASDRFNNQLERIAISLIFTSMKGRRTLVDFPYHPDEDEVRTI